LWEDAQLENVRLRDDLSRMRDDLKSTQRRLDEAVSVSCPMLLFKNIFSEKNGKNIDGFLLKFS
jgi:hypothetical protein